MCVCVYVYLFLNADLVWTKQWHGWMYSSEHEFALAVRGELRSYLSNTAFLFCYCTTTVAPISK